MDEKKIQKKDAEKKLNRFESWYARNWKKVTGAIAGLGGLALIICRAKYNKVLRDNGAFDFNPDELEPDKLADFERLIPEMADEYGVIHRNVLRQDLDGNTTAYWFSTKDIIEPESEE